MRVVAALGSGQKSNKQTASSVVRTEAPACLAPLASHWRLHKRDAGSQPSRAGNSRSANHCLIREFRLLVAPCVWGWLHCQLLASLHGPGSGWLWLTQCVVLRQ